MAELADLDVEIPADDEKPVASDVAVEPKAPKAAAKVIEPEEGIDVLKGRLEQERSGRLAAEKQAREQANVATRAQTEVQDTNVQLVTSAIAQMKQATEGLKGRYTEAMTNGDYSAVADIQAEMAEVAAKRQALETGLDQLKAQPKPQAPRPNDPVEQMAVSIAQGGAPRSAEWLRAHPQYATDDRLTRRMIAAANLAETDGYRIDSDEYFAAVERTLGMGSNDQRAENPMSEAAQPSERRQSPPAAPVSRGANGNGSSPNVVRLTAEQVEAAGLMGLTVEEYARNLRDLKKEGRIVN